MDNQFLELWKAMVKLASILAKEVSNDEDALQVKALYPQWEACIGREVKAGEYMRYKEVLYKVLIDHTTQESWAPDVSPSIFAKVLVDPTGETILAWEQPNSTNPYMKGDKVKHNEKVWQSTIDNNVWEPGVYGWKEVTE